MSITNAPGKGVYPISSFTWILLYENPKDKAQSKVMVDFMKWALTDGQKFAGDLGYAPLPAGGREARNGRAHHHQSVMTSVRPQVTTLGFRLGTGLVRARLVLLVVAIGFELARQSQLSIAKFGLSFWMNDVWDPVSGEFGARPFIWGTLYSSVLALAFATPIALGIAIFLSELCPTLAPRSRSRSSPSCSRRSRRSSTGSGASSCSCQRFERSKPRCRARCGRCRSSRAACRRRHAVRCADSRGDGDPLHLVGCS